MKLGAPQTVGFSPESPCLRDPAHSQRGCRGRWAQLGASPWHGGAGCEPMELENGPSGQQ